LSKHTYWLDAMITVLYFAGIREKIGVAKESMQLPPDANTVAALAIALCARGEKWAEALGVASVKVAVNQTMALPNTVVQDGDEVAFFPPVTGG